MRKEKTPPLLAFLPQLRNFWTQMDAISGFKIMKWNDSKKGVSALICVNLRPDQCKER